MNDQQDARPVLFGNRQSGLTRAVRLALGELGIGHTYVDLDSDAIARGALDGVNPYRMTPTYVDEAGPVAETVAILFYLARRHGRLLPEDPLAAAQTVQWTLVAANAIYADTVTGLVTARLVPLMRGEPADEARVASHAVRVNRHIAILEDRLARSGFLAGDRLTIADLMLLPSIDYLLRTPEGDGMMAGAPALTSWFAAIRSRPAVEGCLD
mgnify:CR=1 FL=1